MIKSIVAKGECFASLAKKHGFSSPLDIYEHPANQELRSVRTNMHILQAGDVVTIPDKSQKSIALDPSGCNHIQVTGQTTLFEAIIEDYDGVALSNMPYEIEVLGDIQRGVIDASGLLSVKIDAAAKTGLLRIFLDSVKKNTLLWPLEFGALAPVKSPVGIQARLNNLGYYCANESGKIEQTTREAIIAFKSRHKLNPTADIDAKFIDALESEYGV